MKTWWSSLVTREKLLIAAALALTIIVLIWQAVLTPLGRATAASDEAYRSATAELDQLLAGYAEKRMSALQTPRLANTQVEMTMDAFKGAVTRDAAEKGISISRIQGDDETSISLVFERVQPQQLFYWLQSVEVMFGGRVSRMTLEQAGDGQVRASVELEQST